jgi:hypothetical protein
MTTIFGYNEGEERMKRETMEPRTHVAIDHDYYSNNPERAKRAEEGIDSSDSHKHHGKREHHAFGDSIGHMGANSIGMNPSRMTLHSIRPKAEKEAMNHGGDAKERFALGGAAKVRKHYPFTGNEMP